MTIVNNHISQRKRKRKQRQGMRSMSVYASKGAVLLALFLHPSADPFAECFVIPTTTTARHPMPIATTDLRMTSVANAQVVLQKHPHFHYHNSDLRDIPLSNNVASAWKGIVPKADLVGTLFSGVTTGKSRQIRRGILGADVTAFFDDPVDGARQLLDGCGIKIENDNDETLRHLASALSYFQDYVSFASGGMARKCKARIVASRGPIGIKCPRWHLDHVPVRLIMSLVGPGCDYVPESISPRATNNVYVDRHALNGLDMDDSIRANTIIVPEEAGVVHAKVGEAVVLMGREWDTVGEAMDNGDTGTIHAAAHKSPDLSPFESRVLLTVDLAED
jgi:hypothetical protein